MASFPSYREALRVEGGLPSFLAGAVVDDRLLYLGAWLGPGAAGVQFKRALANFNEAVRKVISLGAGLAASIPLYNMVAHSRLAWIASLAAPTAPVLAAEEKAIQCLTGPYERTLEEDPLLLSCCH